jgi:heptosyltransferase-2
VNVLVVAPAWIGDLLMAGPLLRALGEVGGHRVTVLAPPATRPLVSRLPGVTAGRLAPLAHGRLQLRTRLRLAAGLRRERFDAAVVLPNTFKAALPPFLARIPLRAGYLGEQRRGLLNRVLPLDPERTPRLVDRYLRLAGTVDPALAGADADALRPRLIVDPRGRDRALDRLAPERDGPVLALAPGAEFGPAKRWPPRHFAAVARAQLDRGGSVWLLGGRGDRPAAAAILAELPQALRSRCTDLTGRTGLTEAVDLLSLCDRAVTNDSGLMHVAAAVGVPLVAVFGSTSPAYTPPATDRAVVERLGLACSPCFERTCPLGHTDCLEQLGPERVLAALDRVP